MWKHYQARRVTCQLKLNYLKWRPSRPASASSSVALWWISRWVSVLKITKLQSIYRGLKEKHQKKPVIFNPPPPPLSLFLTVDHPLGAKFFFSHSLPLPLKSKMAAIVFVEKKKLVSKKILSTRSPILRLLCRLNWPVCCKQESVAYHKIQWFKVFTKYFFDKNKLPHGHINVLVDTLTIWQT